MRLRRPLAIALAALALAGCNGDDEGDSRSESEGPPVTRVQTEPDRATRQVRPAGEPRVATVARDLEIPWEIAFLPDGRALITERPGRVRLLARDGRLREQPVAQIEVDATGEGGLLGMAIDPGFERNRFVYLYRTTGSGNEVLRYTLEGERLHEDARILDGLQAGPIHDGGRIRFGPDGFLYVATGEAGNDALAQDSSSRNGKILRLREPRGSGRPEAVSSGHRNVQGFDWEPRSGRMIATEFGPDSDDEVNVIRRGGNYGWPEAQGNEGAPRFIEPIVNYESVIAPSGATFVRAKGSAWTGSYLIGALVGEHVRRLRIEGDRATANEALFAGRFGRVRTVVEGPDGALYVLTSNRDGRGAPRPGDDRVLRIVPPR